MISLDWLFNSFCAARTNERQTSVSPWAQAVTQLVDNLKYDLGPGCHAWPKKVLLPSGEAQLAGCLKRLAGGPLA